MVPSPLCRSGAGGDLRGRRPRDAVRGAGPGRAAQQRPRAAGLRRNAPGTCPARSEEDAGLQKRDRTQQRICPPLHTMTRPCPYQFHRNMKGPLPRQGLKVPDRPQDPRNIQGRMLQSSAAAEARNRCAADAAGGQHGALGPAPGQHPGAPGPAVGHADPVRPHHPPAGPAGAVPAQRPVPCAQAWLRLEDSPGLPLGSQLLSSR